MKIRNIKILIRKESLNFLKKLEMTKKNNTKDSKEEDKKSIVDTLINELIIDIDNYKDKLGFYKHVQLSDKNRNQLLKLFNNKRSIYEINYGYLFHFTCCYIYKLISFKKFKEININPENSKYLNITSAVAGGSRVYSFAYNFTKKMIKEKNNNLLDFCKEILPIIFIICEFILKNENYEFVELIKDDSPDFYILYKDKTNNKSYVWPIEIGGIYIEYKLENETQKVDYNDILNTTFIKLGKYKTYNDHSDEFTSKDDINKIITNKLGKDWELKKPLIALFPINKRICKYELLQIIDELKKTFESNKEKFNNVLDELKKEDPNEFTSKDNINKIITNKLGKDWELKKLLISLFPINKHICKDKLLHIIDKLKKNYNDVLDELNKEDPDDAKIQFFYFNSFYCDTLIYLLSKKTNFEKSVPAHDLLLINFKNSTIENKNKSISLYQVDPSFPEEDKKLIEDVIKVLEYDDNILEGNKIKNIHCKNDGDIESIELRKIS